MFVIIYIFKTSTQNGKEVFTHITHMMYGRKEGSFSVSHIKSDVCLSLAFNHVRHENMAKVVKLQKKVSEVTFNELWSGWPCVLD